MGLNVATRNAMLDSQTFDFVTAHTADPGETGTSQTGVGVAITFSAASAGNRDSSTTPAIAIGAGVTVTHLGFWDGDPATTGVFKGDADITDETFASAGNLNVTDADISAT